MISPNRAMAWAALIIVAGTASAQAASVELWPSERRANNTLYCYGGDWNAALISIYAQDYGKHRFDLPDRFSESTVLIVDLPQDVTFLGAQLQGDTSGTVRNTFEMSAVERDGEAYQRVRIPLLNDVLTQRLVSHSYYYRIHVWYDAPEELDSDVAYELRHGDTLVAAGGSRLVTAGVVRADRRLPKRFGFYPYGCFSVVPDADFDRMAAFYSRFGISGIEAHWPYGLPEEKNERYHAMFAANRRHGVLNNANMTLFARTYGKDLFGARRETTLEHGGLVNAMNEVCAGLTSDAARDAWRQAHTFFDLTHWDWEPTGPDMWPGYDDKATVTAFAREQEIKEPLSEADLKTTYRDAYREFRMRQIARPLYAMQETIDSVKPIPFRIEQGSGASRHIDYDIYGNDFDAVTPMIYQPSPLGYARNLLETLRSTSVPARKFWPDLTIGWPAAKVHRESPEGFLLDTIVTAAAGCGSVSHWPGIHLTDASWYGIHEGLTRIALVEDFYFDGTQTDRVSTAGIPYRREQIDLGTRTIEQVAPDWRTSLIAFEHELEGDVLLTLINYHLTEDAFVAVAAPAFAGKFLVDPVNRRYLTFDDDGDVVVRVRSQTPGLWIATADRQRIADSAPIDRATVQQELAEAKAAFLKANKTGTVQLGKVGNIDVSYGLTDFGKEERTVVNVSTPTQTVAFGTSGGRIYGWAVKGIEPFVADQTFGTDGFCMDMLWLPETARWSGDEIQEMVLTQCENDGTEAKLVFEGTLTKGFPGITLRKTYRIPAGDNRVSVDIDLFNERVDSTPATLAYWGHNVLSVPQTTFINDTLVHETDKGANTIFPRRDLPEDLKAYVLMPESIVAPTGPVYAEYFPERQAGLVFRLPDNVMNVYRWSARTKTLCGSEWMTQPFSVAAGHTARVSFSITAVPDTTPEAMQKRILAAATKTNLPHNLLACRFEKLGDDGLPAQYKITKAGANPENAVVTAEPDQAGAVVIIAHMPDEASVYVDTAMRTRLDPEGDYFLTVQVKVDDMHYTGNWFKRPAGIKLYIYGVNDKHTWLAIHGEGSTDGWVTGILPFPKDNTVRQQLSSPNVLLRCYNMTGTVRFKQPMILKQPAGANMQRAFELHDGTRITGGQLQLRR